jgi:hypothetical protein
MVVGSCLCGGVRFEVDGPISGMGNCHCSDCRKGNRLEYQISLHEVRLASPPDRGLESAQPRSIGRHVHVL